ncbi:MAG: hypothetical protein V4675_14595 [Verrucomicrobiota bacterium]
MKSDLLDRRIADLEQELVKLRQRKVAQLRDELSQLEADINGTRPAKPTSKGWAADLMLSSSETFQPAPTSERRGTRQSDEEVLERLRKVVAAAGSEGISARAAALKAGVFYLRAIPVMAESFTRTGKGKWTRYTMK